MKLKLEFRDTKGELVFTQEADMPEGGSVNWGPCKVGISIDGGPVHDMEGHLNIREDVAMVAPVEMGASAAVLNVTHHDPEEEQ